MAIGILLNVINISWIIFNLILLYQYHFTSIMFFYRVPDWVLILQTILCVINTLFAIKLIQNRVTISKGVIINVILLAIGLITEIIV